MADSPQDFKKSKGKDKGRGGGSSKGKGPATSSKLRGMEKDSPDVRISKTLSWLLRHGAASQGLAMRQDGYVNVDELLNNPKLKSTALDPEGLQAIVNADAKKRYDLRFEKDQEESAGEAVEGQLPEIPNGSWWIKANQGHSIKTVQLELKPITSLDDIPSGLALHGTTEVAWRTIEKEGLSKMKRNHIHLAQGASSENAISGLRRSAQILIFIDIPKALDAGIKFSLSDNGVVLTEGDETGYLKPEFFARVENMQRQPIAGWEGAGPIDSKAVATESSTSLTSAKPKKSAKQKRSKVLEEAMEELTVQPGAQNE